MSTVVTRVREFAADHRSRLAEVGVVAAFVLALEIVVFGGYFSGAVAPQFDFMSGYNTEAFAWWRDGGILNPPQWMHYMWGGYPAVSNLQNSSFYLPVGIVAAVVPYTIRVAAALAALHVAFGAIGLYALVRSWGIGKGVALVGLAGWFFAAGFYSNATQPDLARAYAWLPWLLLVTSSVWPWRRWYGIVGALLVFWQAILGIYPGMIIAIAYTLPIWILLNHFLVVKKFTRYLLPLALTGIAAIAMTLVRYLPALLERGDFSAVYPDQSEFGIASIGAFLFPYDNPLVPSYEVMRSFFLPALFLPLLVFVPWKNVTARALAFTALPAVLFGFPFWPWHDFVTFTLPGMLASRFRTSDFKVILLVVIVLLGLFALDRLVRRAATAREAVAWRDRPLTSWIPLALLVALTLGFALIGARYEFEPLATIPQWLLLAGSSAVLWWLYSGARLPDPKPIVAGLLGLVIVSGTLGAYAVTGPWRTDRAEAEVNYFGAPIASYLAQRDTQPMTAQRPARQPVPEVLASPDDIYWKFGSVFYSGDSSVFGYVNLRGTESWETIKSYLYQPGDIGLNAAAFWNAAGVVIEGAASTVPSAREIAACADTGECGDDLSVTPLAYNEKGSFSYQLDAGDDVGVMLNEAYYEGWDARLCTIGGTPVCTEVATARGTAGQLTLDVPEGEWRLELKYTLPGFASSWAVFWAALVFAALLAAFVELFPRWSARRASLRK